MLAIQREPSSCTGTLSRPPPSISPTAATHHKSSAISTSFLRIAPPHIPPPYSNTPPGYLPQCPSHPRVRKSTTRCSSPGCVSSSAMRDEPFPPLALVPRQRNPFLQRPPGLYFQFCNPLLDHRHSGMYAIQSLAHGFLRLGHFRLLLMNLLQTAPQRQFLPVVSGYRKMTASHLSCLPQTGRKKTHDCPLPTACPFYQTSGSPSNGMRGAKGKARGQRLTAIRVFTIAQRMDYRDSKLIRTLRMANTMQNDPHLGAAEFHQLAAQACRDATAHHVRKIT
jgi:hypothetical protein